MSPCARWNSVPPSDHSIRRIPRCGRCSVSEVESGSSTAQRMTKWAACRERRVAQTDGAGVPPRGASALDHTRGSRRTRRRRGRSRRPGAEPPRRSPRRAGTRCPVSTMQRRAVSSCAGVTSTPTGRAPCFASHAEKYAVPQPSSITSRPPTSPSTPSSRSGTPNMPHVNSSFAHAREASMSVYSAFDCVQSARFSAT